MLICLNSVAQDQSPISGTKPQLNEAAVKCNSECVIVTGLNTKTFASTAKVVLVGILDDSISPLIVKQVLGLPFELFS